MPSIQNILNKNEKRLDITEYCKDILDEGEEFAWITIKKMTKELKRKVNILSMESMSKESSTKLIEKIEEKGLTLKDIENLKELDEEKTKKILEVYKESDINVEEQKKLDSFKNEIEKIVFESCIDSKKHNFFDKVIKEDKEEKKLKEEKVPIDLSDYKFWNNLGKDNLVNYIYNEIKSFSEDFFFSKAGKKK